MPRLSQRALQGLKQYVYKPAGYTKLDELHTPAWNWVVARLPLWLAPNTITLIGLSCILASYAVSSWYLPDLEGDAPRFVYALNALAIFLYLNLDCLDGKQARRTGTSSPLGQLFDHGCDALSVPLLISTFEAMVSAQRGWRAALGALAIMGPWLLAHWEEYHTGVMLYGNGYWGVLEANYFMIAFHLGTAAAGPAFWRRPLAELLGREALPWPLPARLLPSELMLLTVSGCALQQFWGIFGRVLWADGSKQLAAEERGAKGLGRRAAAGDLAQLALLLAAVVVVMWQPAWAPGEGWPAYLAAGIVYAWQASKLIVDHMTKEPFEVFWWPIAALGLLAANNRVHLIAPAAFAWGAAAAVTAGYVGYILAVIGEVCASLGIECLRIPAPHRG